MCIEVQIDYVILQNKFCDLMEMCGLHRSVAMIIDRFSLMLVASKVQE